jgi:hypothetical protein
MLSKVRVMKYSAEFPQSVIAFHMLRSLKLNLGLLLARQEGTEHMKVHIVHVLLFK